MKNTSSVLNQKFSSLVFHGDKEGRQIGFPTVNLDPTLLPHQTEKGVYASVVEIDGQKYAGALYFGPRTIHNEITDVLEIFLLDFNQEIYGQTIIFWLKSFIRPVIHFNSLPELQKQLQDDIEKVRKAYENK